VTSSKLNRVYVTCFNAVPGIVQDFKMPKSKGDGEFTINYMEGAYCKEGEFGEFYIEFQEKVWEHKVAEQFKSMGTGQVSTITFQHNDGQESASNALLRVMQLGEKTGYRETRGQCPASLLAKTSAKLDELKKAGVKGEFDEKIQAALKASLDGINGGVGEIKDKVEGIHEDVRDVKDEMRTVVADLRTENALLTPENKRINLLRDQLEYKVGRQTSIENKLDFAVVDLHEANKKIKTLEKELEVYKALDLSHKANETAKWIIESGQSLKRPRED